MLPGYAGQVVTVRYLRIFLGDRLKVPAEAPRLCGRVAGHRGSVGRQPLRGHRLAVPGLGERGGQRQPPCAVT